MVERDSIEGTSGPMPEARRPLLRIGEQGAEEARTKSHLSQGSSQEPRQSLPLGHAHVIEHGFPLASTQQPSPQSGGKTMAGNAGLKIHRFEPAPDTSGTGGRRQLDFASGPVLVGGMTHASFALPARAAHADEIFEVGGHPAANRRTAAVPGGGTSRPPSRCGTEESKSTTSILVQGQCSQGAEAAVAETQREEHAVTLTSRGGTSQPRRGGQSENEESRTNEPERGRCSQDAGTRPGIRREEQGMAVALRGGTRQQPLGCSLEDKESRGDGLEQGCLPEAKARAETTREALAVALKCRASRQPCAMIPTRAKQKEALRPANDKPRNGEERTRLGEKVLEEPTACLPHTAAGDQNPFPPPDLTSADSPECSKSKHVHQQPPSQPTGRPQSSAVPAESLLQKGGEAHVTPADGSAEILLVQMCTAPTSKSNRAREGGPGNRTYAVQPTLPCKLPPVAPANGRTLAKGTWSACKPFPKKETVIKAKHGTTVFSSAAFGTGAVRTVVNQKCAQPQVMSGTQKHLENQAVRPSVRRGSFNAGAEGGSELHEPTSAEFLAVAPLQGSCEPFRGQSTEEHGEQVGSQGPPALPSAVVEYRQNIDAPNPAAATTLTKNMTSPSRRQTTTSQSTARPRAARQGRASQVSRPCKLTDPLAGPTQSHCIQRNGTGSPSACKAGGASRREHTQESKGVKATAACSIATRADTAENGRLLQAQHHCRLVPSSLKAAPPVNCRPASRHACPPWTGSATVCKSAPLLPVQVDEPEGSKSPGGGGDLTGDTEAHTNATEDGVPAVAVPLVGAVNGTEPQFETESESDSEACPVFTGGKQDEQLDSADKGAASPSVRRYPFVPLLPLHLLPGILARKDAEEAAFERAYGISYQEYEDIMWQLSLDNKDQQSVDRRAQERAHSFGDNISFLSPTSKTGRKSAADQAHHAASKSSHVASPAQVSARNDTVSRDEEGPKASREACSRGNVTESVVELASNNTIYYLLPEKETDVSLPALVQDGCNDEVTGATVETAFPPLACAQLRPVDLSYYLSDDDEETQQELPKAFCLVPATLPHTGDATQYCEGSGVELADLLRADTRFPGESPRQAPDAAFQRTVVLPGNQAETAESFRNETLALGPSKPKPVLDNNASLKECSRAQQERAMCDTGSRPRGADLPATREKTNPQPHPHAIVTPAALKADPKGHMQSKTDISLEATQKKRCISRSGAVRRNETCGRSGPALTRPRRAAATNPKPQPRQEALPTLRPPGLNPGGHAPAARAQPRDMPKKGQPGSCAPHVNAPTLATSHSRKHQPTILQSQQEVKRVPTQMKVRLQVEGEPRNAMVAVRTIAGRGRQRALLGEKQGSRTEMTHPTSTTGKAGSPQGRKSPHKQGKCQCSYAPNGKSRSVSLAGRQAAVSRPCAAASQILHQQSKPRSYHHSLKHTANNCAKRTTSTKRNEVPCLAPLPPPLARRYPGTRGQDSRHAPGRIPRPPVLRSPLTSSTSEDRNDQAAEANYTEAPLRAQSGIMPLSGQEVDTVFAQGSASNATTGDNPTSLFSLQIAGHFPPNGGERRSSPGAAAAIMLEAAGAAEASCHSRGLSGMQLAQTNGPSQDSLPQRSEATGQATIAAPTTAERDRQHVLSGSNQGARTKMTHPTSTPEHGDLPVARPSAQKEGGHHLSCCLRNAKARSASLAGRQATKSKPCAAASPQSHQQSKQRPYHHSLRRPPDNSAKPTTPLKRNEAFCSALIPPPVARKCPGVREHGPKQEPGRILRPPVLHSSLTSYTLECGPDEAEEVTYLAPALQVSSGVMRKGGEEDHTGCASSSTFFATKTRVCPSSRHVPQIVGQYPSEGEGTRSVPEAPEPAKASIPEAPATTGDPCDFSGLSERLLTRMDGAPQGAGVGGPAVATDATIAARMTAGREKQRLLSGPTQDARSEMAQASSSTETGGLPQTRTSTQNEGSLPFLACVRHSEARSNSMAGRQAAISISCAAASRHIQQSKHGPYTRSLKSPSKSCDKGSTSIRHKETLCSAQVPPPLARKCLGVKEHGPQQAPGQILRAPVLHNSVTSFTLEGETDHVAKDTYLEASRQHRCSVTLRGGEQVHVTSASSATSGAATRVAPHSQYFPRIVGQCQVGAEPSIRGAPVAARASNSVAPGATEKRRPFLGLPGTVLPPVNSTPPSGLSGAPKVTSQATAGAQMLARHGVHSAQVPPPLARKCLGEREHGPTQAHGRILRPPVLQTPLTSCTSGGRANHAKVDTYVGAPGLEQCGVMLTNSKKVDTAFAASSAFRTPTTAGPTQQVGRTPIGEGAPSLPKAPGMAQAPSLVPGLAGKRLPQMNTPEASEQTDQVTTRIAVCGDNASGCISVGQYLKGGREDDAYFPTVARPAQTPALLHSKPGRARDPRTLLLEDVGFSGVSHATGTSPPEENMNPFCPVLHGAIGAGPQRQLWAVRRQREVQAVSTGAQKTYSAAPQFFAEKDHDQCVPPSLPVGYGAGYPPAEVRHAASAQQQRLRPENPVAGVSSSVWCATQQYVPVQTVVPSASPTFKFQHSGGATNGRMLPCLPRSCGQEATTSVTDSAVQPLSTYPDSQRAGVLPAAAVSQLHSSFRSSVARWRPLLGQNQGHAPPTNNSLGTFGELALAQFSLRHDTCQSAAQAPFSNLGLAPQLCPKPCALAHPHRPAAVLCGY